MVSEGIAGLMSNKIAKWQKSIGLACLDCGNLMLSRRMFVDLHRMISANGPMQQEDYFHEYMRDTYVAHVFMSLRRHIKIHRDSISLSGVVLDMLENAGELANASNLGELRAAYADFREKATKVEGFADRVVAHHDRSPPRHIPTYREIDEAIESMDRLAVQASLAAGGSYSDTCEPTVQGGWLNVFRDMGVEF